MTFVAQLLEEEYLTQKQAMQSAELSLILPGKILNMSVLINQKKFRYTGNKQGGLDGWKLLDVDGLGVLSEQKAGRGTDKVISTIICSWLCSICICKLTMGQ